MYHFIEVKLLKNNSSNNKQNQRPLLAAMSFTYFKCHYSRFSVISGFGVILIVLGGSLGLGIGMGYFAFLVEDTQPQRRKNCKKKSVILPKCQNDLRRWYSDC